MDFTHTHSEMIPWPFSCFSKQRHILGDRNPNLRSVRVVVSRNRCVMKLVIYWPQNLSVGLVVK